MPIGFKDISGLTHNQANTGMAIAAIPGDSGFGPQSAVLTASASGLPPNDASITIQLFPTGKVANGTDLNGNISVQATLVNSGDDKTFAVVADGNITLTDGFWAQHIRGVVNSLNGTRGFNVQFSDLDVNTDFNTTLTQAPSNLRIASPADGPFWDDPTQEGNVTITFNYDNTPGENPAAFVIMRTKVGSGNPATPVGSTPVLSPITNTYTFQDFVFASGEYTYTVRAYLYGTPNEISVDSNVLDIIYGGPIPDIDVTGGGGGTGSSDSSIPGGLDIGGAATFVFIADPSGIYELVPFKTHDTLYERTDVTSVDVAIPDPYLETAYLGDGEYINHFNATRIRVVGSGNLKQTLHDLSGVNALSLANLVMQDPINYYPTILTNFMTQKAQLRIEVTEIDESFEIREIIVFSKPVFSGVPQ